MVDSADPKSRQRDRFWLVSSVLPVGHRMYGARRFPRRRRAGAGADRALAPHRLINQRPESRIATAWGYKQQRGAVVVNVLHLIPRETAGSRSKQQSTTGLASRASKRCGCLGAGRVAARLWRSALRFDRRSRS